MNPCNEIDCDNLAGLLDSITPIQCESIANGDGIDPLDATDSCQDTQTVIDRLQEMEDAISEGSIVIAANQESACYKPGLPTHASILNTTKQALQMVKCIICAPNKDAKAYHYNYNYDSAVTTQPDTVPANLVTGDTVIENFNDVIKYWTWNGSSWVLDFQIDKSDTVEITDGDLAVPGTPTITDVQNYATANGLNNTAIYYVGAGTTDNPDYVWIVDEQGNIVNVENPIDQCIKKLEITDADLATAGVVTQADVQNFATTNNFIGVVYYIGSGSAEKPQETWLVGCGAPITIDTNETLTVLGQPTLSAGNILTIPYTDEDGVTNNVTVDLSALAIDINTASFTYNPLTGDLVITETDGSVHTVDIGPFVETVTTLTNTQATGNIIGTYTNEDGTVVNIRETPLTVVDSGLIDLSTSGTADHTLTATILPGSAGDVLTTVGGVPTWQAPVAGAQTPNSSPNGTILTSGTDSHALDVNAPLKTTVCAGDVTPADAVAEYNPVHRAADGTLWAKTDASMTSSSAFRSASNLVNTNLNPINTPIYRSETTDVSYTNNTCRPMTVYITYYATVQTLINSGDRVEVKLQMSYDGGVTWGDALREVTRLGSTALEFPHSMAGSARTVLAPGATWTSRGRVCLQSLSGTGSWHLTSNVTVVQMEVTQ